MADFTESQYVEQNPDGGYNVVIDGQLVASYDSQAAAEQQFNMQAGEGGSYTAPTSDSGGGGTQWREYGVDNGDGTVTVWKTDDAGNYEPVRTESTATNQVTNVNAPARATQQTLQALAAARQRLTAMGWSGTDDQMRTMIGNTPTLFSGSADAWIRTSLGMPAGGASYVPPPKTGAGSQVPPPVEGAPTYNPTAVDQQLKAMYQAYLNTRLQQLEIPQFQVTTQLERDRLAQQTALQYGAQAGYVIPPQMFASYVSQQIGAVTQAGIPLTQARSELVKAGGDYWNGAPDDQVRSEYYKLAQLRVTGDPLLTQPGTTGGVTTPFNLQGLAPTLERQQFEESIRQVDRSYTENVRQYGLDFAERQRQFDTNAAYQKAGLTGYYDNKATLPREQFEYDRNMQIQQLLANPRNFAQSLQAMGMAPQEASQFIQKTPLYQTLNDPYKSLIAPPQGGTMPFIQGQQLPVRQTLSDINTQSTNIPLISSMASFAGQDPEQFWARFQSYLPQGNVAPVTSVR